MKKMIRDGSLGFVIMSMLTMFMFVTGCSAHPCTKNSHHVQQKVFHETDSVMKNAVGDSIFKIIAGAKRIKAEEIVLTNDTVNVKKEASMAVRGKYAAVAQFVLSNPKLYNGDVATYGNFMPCFKLTFIINKRLCVLNFDFGLKKWNVCDGTGKQIKMFDLPSDDMLRLANILFPENELYKNLINIGKR